RFGAGDLDIKQSFKVPLTAEFISQFKHVPSQNSGGTGFYCSGGAPQPNSGDTRFIWWLGKTTDDRWHINMWGSGFESLDGAQFQSHNPSVSQYMTIKQLQDLDMTYQLSFVGKDKGRNIQFSAKYVAAKNLDTN